MGVSYIRTIVIVGGVALTLSGGMVNSVAAQQRDVAASINPADYPTLDDKELGSIRRIVKLSRLMPGDWSGMQDDAFGTVERLKLFEIGYAAAMIGLVQHNYTPAYRELYRPTMDALIQKLTLPDVWEYWMSSSRVGTVGNPDASGLTEGWIDPVRKYNIFLKGYLVQSAAMYEMLYRDGKYNKPDAFTFRYVPNTWGNGAVTFRYSLPDLAKIVHQEFVDRNYQGVLCEPNRMYPACNQPPILGLVNYDQVYGTDYAGDVIPKFKAAWIQNGYTNPVTKQNVSWVEADQNKLVWPGSAVLDGWVGGWMPAWAPEMMQKIYPGQRDLYINKFLNGSYAKDAPPMGAPEGGTAFLSLGYGLVGFMAAEVGDNDSRQKLLAYADRNFNPVWEDGAYYYPRSGDYKTDANGNSHGMDTWTGNVLLALMRLDKGHGFYRLYHEPWGQAELTAPQVTNVDYLVTNVSQAYYDAKKSALIVTVKPGPMKAKQTSFVVQNLDPVATYTVVKDGRIVGRVSPKSRQIGTAVVWRPDGDLTVNTEIDRAHSFVIVSAPKNPVNTASNF